MSTDAKLLDQMYNLDGVEEEEEENKEPKKKKGTGNAKSFKKKQPHTTSPPSWDPEKTYSVAQLKMVKYKHCMHLCFHVEGLGDKSVYIYVCDGELVRGRVWDVDEDKVECPECKKKIAAE